MIESPPIRRMGVTRLREPKLTLLRPVRLPRWNVRINAPSGAGVVVQAANALEALAIAADRAMRFDPYDPLSTLDEAPASVTAIVSRRRRFWLRGFVR